MKVHVLMENTACSSEFFSQHGLSLYVETEGHRVLFDTGADGKFAANAEKMGLSTADIDLAFLSHGHYDHGGGLKTFLELNDHAPVYVSPLSFGHYYNASDKYIGLDADLKDNSRLVHLTEHKEIYNLELFPAFENLRYALASIGHRELKNGKFVQDKFLHEQYLLINEGGRRILLSGCSHRGILNIMSEFKPDVLIGGFHFSKQQITDGKNAVLDEAAEVLNSYDSIYYTCHCTGIEQYKYLKARMGSKLNYISAGQSIEI